MMNPDGSGQTRLTNNSAYDISPNWGIEPTTTTKIGVYQNGIWYIDNDGSGTWNADDKAYSFGAPGWTPA